MSGGEEGGGGEDVEEGSVDGQGVGGGEVGEQEGEEGDEGSPLGFGELLA